MKGKIVRIKVAPSILSADFSCLEKEIKRVERSGADMLHIDVMDGHFVPNITIGPVVVKNIRKITRLPLDVHLMIEQPQKYLKNFADAGVDMITMHIETIGAQSFRKQSAWLKSRKIKVGISLNPDTSIERLKPVLKYADFILVMSVFPGFGGQKFIPAVLPKIRKLRSLFRGEISVDGGINDQVAAKLIDAGVDILAVGSYIFGAKDTKKAIERIRNAGTR